MNEERRAWLAAAGRWLAAAGALLAAGFAVKRSAATPTGRSPTGDDGRRRMDFSDVVPGDHVPNSCTPRLPPDFVGLRIHAPETVGPGAAPFVVCGAFRFPADYLYRLGSALQAVVLVAVDARTHVPRACTLTAPGETPEPGRPRQAKDPEWMKNHSVQSYFNVGLPDLMATLPTTPADYYVYALIEDHVSNVVRIAVKG